jgi:hypothetical protein
MLTSVDVNEFGVEGFLQRRPVYSSKSYPDTGSFASC